MVRFESLITFLCLTAVAAFVPPATPNFGRVRVSQEAKPTTVEADPLDGPADMLEDPNINAARKCGFCMG